MRALALLLACAAVAGCVAPRSARVPTTSVGGLVLVEVDGRGAEPLLALLDTGASASAIDPRSARDLRVVEVSKVVGTTGSFDAEIVAVRGLRVGGLVLPELRATRRDLGGLLAPPGRRVDMILGSDALRGLAVTLDFDSAALELRRGDRADARVGAGVAMDVGETIPSIDATLAGLPVRLRIDTGASLFDTPDVYVNVPATVWDELRARDPALAPSAALSGTGADGETVSLPVARIDGATIGPSTHEHVFVIVQPRRGYFADPNAHGFVGNNWLRGFGRVTLDYANGRLRAGS